jgi:hypothetical protein
MPILVLGKKNYQFDASEFSNKEGMAIEAATGMSWQEFIDGGASSTLAKTALVWMVRKRNGEPNLRFDEVDFAMKDFGIELDEEQKKALQEAAEAAANPPVGDDATSPAPGDGPSDSPTSASGTGSSPRRSSASRRRSSTD